MLSLLQNGVEQWGLPSRVPCDYGIENFYVGQYMIEHRGEGKGSIITESSVHNSRVERAYQDVFSGVLGFYAGIFEQWKKKAFLTYLMMFIYSALTMSILIHDRTPWRGQRKDHHWILRAQLQS